MRITVYLTILIIFVLAVLNKSAVIQEKENKQIVSIAEEWKKNGKPVDVAVAGIGKVYCYEKVSGVVETEDTVRADVTEKIVKKLDLGQELAIIDSNKKMRGYVKLISQSRDIVTGLFKVILKIEDKIPFKPGAIVVSRVRTKTIDDIVKIPAGTVIKDGDTAYCWVISGRKAVKREVTLGMDCNGYIQVIKGIAAGERVCIRGLANLEENDTVLIRKEVPQ